MPTHDLSINPSLHSISLAILALIVAIGAVATPVAAQPSTSLDTCPARQPILRIAIVSGGEAYSSHPAETRFSSTHFTRLHQMPLISADPKEERIDAAYGVAESWMFLPGAKGMIIKIRDGLTFNDGTPITAEDVVFSLSLSASRFADPQIFGTLNGIGISAKAIDSKTVQIDFAKGSPTFDIEISTMVFPVYVTSKAYHSGGEISQAAFDRFRAKQLADAFRRHNVASVDATLPFYQDEARRMSIAKQGREELEQQFARDRERFEREHGGSGWKP